MSLMSALRECHRLRAHLRDLQAEIDRGPRILKEHQDELEGEKAAHKAHHDAITALKLKQRDDEGALKQTETRLAKLGDQLEGLIAQKERAAKELEIVHAKEKQGELEDTILATITELEDKIAAIPAVEAKWKEAQAEFAAFQTAAAERLEAMKADTTACQADLAKAETELPADVKRTYDTIVKAKGAESFAAVKNRVCQGCRATMAEQLFTDLRRGTFRVCSTCGRMQYPAE